MAVFEIVPDDAVIVAEPTATPFARPELFTVAIVGFVDDHVTDLVMSFWVPLE